MKRFSFLILAATIVVAASCNYIAEFNKPHLTLTGDRTYQLDIKDFVWGYGVTSFNQFNGNFDKLDKEVYNLLRGRQGICKVYMQETGKDKYGNANGSMNYIGDIDINELNKYQDWQYWQRNIGTRSLLYKRFIASPDTSKIDTVIQPTLHAPQDVMKSKGDTTMKLM